MRRFHTLPKIPSIPSAKHRRQQRIKQVAKKIYAKMMRRVTGNNDDSYSLLLFIFMDRCWCRQGFTGSLCEYPEELRECEEDYCLHKGVGKLVNTTSGVEECNCQCQEHHSGKRCEIVLPCKEYTCLNGGICVNEPVVENSTNGELTYKARCDCPRRNVYGVAATFEGEHCEKLTVVDDERVYDECFPCRKNAKDYVADCLDEYTQNSTLQYMKEILETCGKPCESAARFCLNGGLCDVEGRLDEDNVTSYIIPVCQCVGLDEGILCENHVISPCDKSTYDPRTPEEKCGEHGTCVGKTMHDYVCDCYPGWTGEKCDIEEPCYNNACSPGSLCVSVPIEQREKYSLGYTCLCEMNQDLDFAGSNNTVQCIKADFRICTSHICKNDGLCYPCEVSDPNSLQLCSDEEKSRGFKCLCPYGLLPPLCEKEADACYQNKCQNGAECAVDPENEFNYICHCRLGFAGSFCEQELSPCIIQGLKTCIMGTCVQDNSFVRGFRCECVHGYEGVNCDLSKRTDILSFIRNNYWWTYPLIMCLLVSPTVIGLIILMEDRAEREYEHKLAEKQYLKEVKGKMNDEIHLSCKTKETQTMHSIMQNRNNNSTKAERISFESKSVAVGVHVIMDGAIVNGSDLSVALRDTRRFIFKRS
uniref:EGF-like domain-containing protein n=1 Tax=Setaria digitata TaxID=48799 RepID=A0A915Q2S2_9BILA